MSEITKTPIDTKIFFLRGRKVMFSHDLAELYEVKPKALIQAIKRNQERFPDDFMFQLSPEEAKPLKFQIGISKTRGRGGARRALAYAFTEQGVAMLSSVLRSKRAIRVNIEIMRAFARLKEILALNKDFAKRLEELEKKYSSHDAQFQAVFDAIRELMKPPDKPKRRIGFAAEESRMLYRV